MQQVTQLYFYKELKERLEARKNSFGICCESPTIMTFHALGLKILKQTESNTKLSVFANDPIQLEHWFTRWFEHHISQSYTNMKRFIDLAYQLNDTFQIPSTGKYKAYVSDSTYKTLQGEKVKSHQELLIANWLFINSVDYRYQGNYVSNRRITVGRECDNTLIETHDDDFIEDNLESRLAEQMDRNGIALERKSPEVILTALKNTSLLAKNTKRYIKLLQAIRVEQLNSEQVETRLNNAKVHHAKKYTQLLHEIVQAYKAELMRQKAIDFDDMTTFIASWYADDYDKELGPVTGTAPHLIPTFDNAFDIEEAIKIIAGSARSMGIQVKE